MLITPDIRGGGWLAAITNLPGCMSDGETPEEAIDNLEDAKKSWICFGFVLVPVHAGDQLFPTCLELGRPVPEPVTDEFSGQLRIRIPKSLHRILAERAREEKVSLNQYINYQLSRGVGYKP